MPAIPAWVLLFFRNGWGFPNAGIQVPSHGVALLHHAINFASRLSC